MGDLLSEFGDLVFTLVIGYIGAIEFLYVVRHLYHWSFNHDGPDNELDADSLARLQENLRQQLANASATEANAGKNAMQDGVLYADGFRIDPNQGDIDSLKEQLKNKSAKDLKRQELEKELNKQKEIEEKTRKELEEAEAAYARQQREAEENERKIIEAEQQRERAQKQREEEEKRQAEEAEAQRKRHEEEQQKLMLEEKRKEEEEEQNRRREEEQRKLREAEESARKLIEAEQEREREQRRREEEEENARILLEAERLREQQQRQAEEEAEREENERRILEAERQMEEAQRNAEYMEENERNILNIERNLEETMRDSEYDEELTDNERQLIASIKERDIAEQQDEATAQKEAELLKRILEARDQLGEESEEEQSQRLFGLEQDHELKQKRIDENARLFLEAEKEMADLQEHMLEAVEKRQFATNLESAPQTPVVEEPCIKKNFYPLEEDSPVPPVAHRVKTQLAQNSDDSYSVSTKSLLFPGVSDDASSNEPISSQQSSFSTQPSEEVTTGNESQYPPQERQEPEGEDTAPAQQYSDDYLRSLDGIKSRPLSREDRSGRRIAFKKRRSSGSSNSSRDSRTSRDEELKMFTSLEEEEMQATGDSEFTPIRYSSEPTLKVKGHHRRHKRSPAKDMKSGDDSQRSSLERLGEETINPWGDVVPEHYKNTEFWKREKAVSIDEELEFEKPTSTEEINYDTATNLPSASSFEEATQIQNEEALSNLRQQENKDAKEEVSATTATKDEAARSDTNANLRTSPRTESEASPARSSASPRLRRSPRIEEMDQYEERWKESNESPAATQASTVNTPTITVDKPLDFGTWRDEHDLIMEGLSDFYDFTASVNPSRSRSASRNPSPSNTAPSTPQPKNVSFEANKLRRSEHPESAGAAHDSTVSTPSTTVDKPLDYGSWRDEHGLIVEGLSDFYDFTASVNPSRSRSTSRNPSPSNTAPSTPQPKNVSFEANNLHRSVHPESHVEIFDDTDQLENNEFSKENITKFLDSLQDTEMSATNEEQTTELSLEIPENPIRNHLQYVVDDQPKEKGQISPIPMVNVMDDSMVTISNVTENENDNETSASMASLRSQRSRSRSRSKSPLPTADNVQRSLETRRNKMIKHNEDILEKLIETNLLPETPEPVESTSEDDECSKENMSLLVESLRGQRSRSRSRSRCRSPLPTPDNIERSLEQSRNKHMLEKEELLEKFYEPVYTKEVPVIFTAPLVSIEVTEPDSPKEYEEKENERIVKSSIPISPTIFSAPLVSIEVTEPDSSADPTLPEEEECSRENMASLVQSLRVARSRSRSKSPMRLPTSENIGKSLQTRRSRLIERNDELMQHLEERARTPEPPQLTVEYVYEFVETSDETTEITTRSRQSRSRTPSRSPSQSRKEFPPRSCTPSRSISPAKDDRSHDSNFHVMLNLEGSQNRTLYKNSEEYESTLAGRLKRLDEEALEKLKNASEEIELRTLSPLSSLHAEAKEHEDRDRLTGLPVTEYRKMLRCSPTTPDYDRTISEEMQDVDRIKQEMLDRGFKRSTYVGESMDFVGSEYEPLRREAARFQRSRSPTPSFSETVTDPGQISAAEKRHIQDLVLAELTGSNEMKNTGAIPKSAGMSSTDSDTSLSREVQDTLRIKDEMLSSGFQRSAYVGQSVDASLDFEEMRRRNADFRRSASKSRSPLGEIELAELTGIETEAAKREFRDNVLEEISNTSMNFQDFSRHLNPDFLDNDRRASDSALIQKPEILIQLQDNNCDDCDMEPEEYHHFRRYSLAQELPMEEYPNDDYIFIQQVEVRTRSGSRTWTREDYYSQDIDDFLLKDSKASQESVECKTDLADSNATEEEEAVQSWEISTGVRVEEISMTGDQETVQSRETSPDADFKEATNDDEETKEEVIAHGDLEKDEETVASRETSPGAATSDGDNDNVGEANPDEYEDDEDSNGSEDDRRTVIDVEDEIDEDISDFNERGPAEESHHEQSECEEAEREMDHYAGRDASDWADVDRIFPTDNEVAPQLEDPEGAVGGPSSSPYDSDSFAIDQIYDDAIKNRKQSGILREFDCILNEMTNSFIENSSKDMDEQYALWSRTHKKPKSVEFSTSFIESERKDTEMRYLGDATVSARQSTRLRSRYGYNPVLQTSTMTTDIEVDLNYKPKREYNWRKNFKLSDDDANETKLRLTNIEKSLNDEQVDWDLDGDIDSTAESLDMCKFSLGGESVTIFSQSPEKELDADDGVLAHHESHETPDVHMSQDVAEEKVEKPKKKKTKKKTRKESKGSVEALRRDDDNDVDDYVPPAYSRRSSSIQMDTDSPKRKSRSRRSSRTSLTNDDSFGLYSPRSSVGYAEPIADIMEEYSDVKAETVRPKKIKKRKKSAKEIMADVTESPKEDMLTSAEPELEQAYDMTASTVITPDSASANMLSSLSPQASVCVTPGSEDSESNGNTNRTQVPTSATSTTPTTPVTTPVDTFDILKDANFYPLF